MSRDLLKNQILKEISGRLVFATTDIEARIDEKPRPQPKAWSYPKHALDDVAQEFGLKGFEYRALQNAAMAAIGENAMVRKAYKDFLMIAKLVCTEQLDEVRRRERRIAIDRENQESSFKRKLSDWENRQRSMRSNWNKTREQIQGRWLEIMSHLRSSLEQGISLDQENQTITDLLEARGLLTMSSGQYVEGRWDAVQDLTVEQIHEIMSDLEKELKAPDPSS